MTLRWVLILAAALIFDLSRSEQPKGSRVLRVDVPGACVVVVEASDVASVWILEP